MPQAFVLAVAIGLTIVGVFMFAYFSEDERDFPCLRDAKDDKYYSQRREGLRK